MTAVVSRQGTVDDDSVQSRDLSAFTQLMPPQQPAVPCSPEMWTLLCAQANKAGPSSVAYDFSNVFRHTKVSTTYTSISSLFLLWTQLGRNRDLRWLAATHAGHGLARAFAHMLRRTACTGAG